MRVGLCFVQMSNAVRMRKYWANTIKNDLFDGEYCMNAIFESQSMNPRIVKEAEKKQG
jgi:hypothetical protein